MANFLKTFFITSSLRRFKKTRVKFVINIAIFLSIFAITSSLISIYYETKISKIETKVINLQRELASSEAILKNIPLMLLSSNNAVAGAAYIKELHNFYGESDSRTFSLNYSHVALYQNLRIFAYNGLDIIDQFLIFAEKYNFDPKSYKYWERYLVSRTEIEEDSKKVSASGQNINITKHNFAKYYFNVRNAILQQEGFIIQAQKQIRKKLKVKRKLLTNLKIEIAELSSLSSKIILFAFLLQLIIFIVIQYFEISAARDEKDEKR